ncbi:MAG: PAS domain S-box protein, partial [Bacteroidia bacterium]|nr:PAS domain S-box protein [Bacteroidia bacterium]
ERRFKKKDGTIIEVEINVKILEVERFVIFARDITERKQADKALKAAYEEKNTILERVDDGFFAVDNNSVVTYWNKKAEMVLTTKAEDVIGKNLHEVFASPLSIVFYNHYQKAIRENTTIHFEEFSNRTNKWLAVSAYASSKGLSVFFKDVTDRKNAEDKIKKSEKQFRQIVETAQEGIWMIDENNKTIFVNKKMCEILEYTEEEMIGRTNFSFKDEEEQKLALQQTERRKKGLKETHEAKFITKSGKHIVTLVSTNPIYGEDGSYTGAIAMFTDITERKQAELSLRESNERYNLISKATNDMVWDWNLVAGNVYRNKEGWKKIFGNGKKESEVGSINDWNSRIHPEDIEKVKLVNEEIQNSIKDFFEVECRMMRDDGTYVYIHDRGHIIRNEQGKPVRLIGATQNVTRRKEAELQVAKSELRFRSLIQNGSDLTSILNERGYYTYCSPAVKKLLGYEPEFMIGKNAFSFIHPDDILHIKNHLAKNKTENYIKVIPFRFKNAKGEWRWLESKVTDLSNSPEVQGYVFNSRDVTERKIAEEEINKLSIIARETVNAVIITNPEGEIVWVNEAFTNITEFEFDEVTGKKPGDFLQGEETNLAVVRFIRNELKKVKAFECDIINYSKSGKKYWMRIQSQPQFDETGKLKYFFAIETDITKEKEAEGILKASEER